MMASVLDYLADHSRSEYLYVTSEYQDKGSFTPLQLISDSER